MGHRSPIRSSPRARCRVAGSPDARAACAQSRGFATAGARARLPSPAMSLSARTRLRLVETLRRFRTDTGARPAGVGPRRYGLGRVQAVHLECRAPSGAHFDIVALRGHLVAPEAMRHEPGLWWLESEEYPHLGMEAATALQEAIASRRLGCWPYCVPEDRWNEAAKRTYWLPQTPLCSEFPLDARHRVITDRGLEALELPTGRTDRQGPDTERGASRTIRERL